MYAKESNLKCISMNSKDTRMLSNIVECVVNKYRSSHHFSDNDNRYKTDHVVFDTLKCNNKIPATCATSAFHSLMYSWE